MRENDCVCTPLEREPPKPSANPEPHCSFSHMITAKRAWTILLPTPLHRLLSLTSMLSAKLSLKDELLLIEDAFVAALIEGGDSLTTFEARWEGLAKRIDLAHVTHSLDADTAALAYSTSVRLSALTDASADILAIQETISSDLVCQLDGLLSDFTLADSPIRPPRPPSLIPHAITTSASPSRKRSRTPEDATYRVSSSKRHW